MASEVLFTREAAAWYRGLSDRQADRVDVTLNALQEHGPNLGRPLADRVQRARHHKLKELRPPSTNLRAMFAFDSHGQGIVLTGGDKTNNWEGFYREQTPIADRLLDQHERGITCPTQRTGARSDARGR